MNDNKQSRFPQLRRIKFKEKCSNCIYEKCQSNCTQCGVVGYDKVHGTCYCKCYARAGWKETRCYYYRRKRECKS